MEEGLKWNYFVEFIHFATLEIFISMALANHVVWNEVNTVASIWGRYLCLGFSIIMALYIIFFIIFFFSPWPGKPLDRMEKYKHRVGAIYENIRY